MEVSGRPSREGPGAGPGGEPGIEQPGGRVMHRWEEQGEV